MTHVPDSPPTLAKLLELLSKLIELISASFATPAPAPPPRRPVACSYCSSPRHLIRHCPRVLADIRSGLCKRNALGRVVLPSGLYVPHSVVGPNLRARLLAYTRTQQLLRPPVVHRPVPVVSSIPDPSPRIPISSTATDVPTASEAPAHLQKAPSIEVSSTAPSPPVPPSDPLDDLFRELALLHLHPDPLRLSALERRMAQLRDSS
ncbi:hypothetical protein R3P38DRAFT_3073060 [Favolaschia claudopus]|uniref:Uncharacterized protein n=1 Tax=Favolaschia claudopus TaxID=2862362 RepID=A0AAV9ZY70_9AGAR